jgi:hypothetical protein
LARIALLVLLYLTLVPAAAQAHCDTMAGPVVGAAREALATGNVDLALVWVQEGDEDQVRGAFERAYRERKAGGDAADRAERQFFEQLVRIHRAGEGASFTGLKPAGTDVGPAVRAADAALDEGSGKQVSALLRGAVEAGLSERLNRVLSLKDYPSTDVVAGRRFVQAYVEYTHFVEGVHGAATGALHHETAERAGDGHPHHASGQHPEHHGTGGADHEYHETATSPGHGTQLAWSLVALLALGLVAETGWLVARTGKS